MKKPFYIFILLTSIQMVLHSQDFNNDFGKISRSDVDLTFCTFDKSAEAVVISDLGSSYFERADDNFELIYERTTRLKIFKESGIKWASIEIPYYRKGDIYEEVYDIEATTYNMENGNFSKSLLDLKSCHEEKINEYWNNKKFAMPNVKPGSIIEYRYKVRSQFLFNFRNWEFQWKIPVISSKYVTKMIPFYQYTWLLQGATKFETQKSYEDTGMESQFGSAKYHDMIYEYSMKNIQAFKDEEYITSSEDYIMKLSFQLSKVINLNGVQHNILTTWPELVKEMISDEDFGGYVRKAENAASKIFDLKTLSLLPEQQKYDSVLNYVKSNYSWNKIYGKRATKSPKTFMKDKFGNDADINLFTVGQLNAVGIKASPVMISTRENGKIKIDYPFVDFFNYVIIIAGIDNKMVLSDATSVFLSNDRISEKCINDKGLIIQKNKVDWVNLQSLIPSKIKKTLFITLSDSTQNATIQSNSTEYSGLDNRTDFGSNARTISKYLLNKGYQVVDSSIVVENQANIKNPYILKFKIEDHPEKVKDKIYVSPFLREVITENPLKQVTRTYPIDMIYPKLNSYFTQINIPTGYKVEFLPANDKITNDMFELEYSTTVTNDKINVVMIYYFKVPVYDASEYSKLKYYFNEIITKGAEKIVFVKNE